MNILAKVKEYFRTNRQLRGDLAQKTAEAQGYKDSTFTLLGQSTAEIVVGKALNRPIKWFDASSLAVSEQRAYYQEAQQILKGQVFNNELNAYILDLVEEIAKRSTSFEHVQLLRTKIAMGEALRDRVAKIPNPDKAEVTKENIYSAI